MKNDTELLQQYKRLVDDFLPLLSSCHEMDSVTETALPKSAMGMFKAQKAEFYKRKAVVLKNAFADLYQTRREFKHAF